MHKKIFTIFVGLFLVSAPIALAASETTAEPAAYISYLEGNVFFQNFEKATVDMGILQGDELITTKGRIEVYLGNGNFLRLDQNTRVNFIALEEKTMLGIWSGSVYLRINTAIEVQTLHQNFILEMGLYRIDAGQKTKFYKNPRLVDNFDSWNEGRENEINRPATVEIRYLPRGLYYYYNWRWPLLYQWHPFWPPIRHSSYRQYYPQRTVIRKNQLVKRTSRNTVNRPTIQNRITPAKTARKIYSPNPGMSVQKRTTSPRSYLSRTNTQFRPSPKNFSPSFSRPSYSPYRSFSKPPMPRSPLSRPIRKKN